MRKYYILFMVLMMSLSGCVGSYLVHQDDSDHDYDNLSSVPDRPQGFNANFYKKEMQRLKHQHSDAILKNEQLRDKESTVKI